MSYLLLIVLIILKLNTVLIIPWWVFTFMAFAVIIEAIFLIIKIFIPFLSDDWKEKKEEKEDKNNERSMQ